MNGLPNAPKGPDMNLDLIIDEVEQELPKIDRKDDMANLMKLDTMGK